MKLKSILLTAFAVSTTLAACDKSDESGPAPDQRPKSVTVTLPNINTTPRAIGNKLAAGQAALANFKIFFLDAAGNVQEVPTYGEPAAAQRVYFDGTEGAEIPTGTVTYHFLPAATTQVVVVGNVGDKSYAEIFGDSNNKTYPVLNDGDAGITTTANGNPLYPLYGQANLTPKNGAETEESTHTNVYTAAVELAPQVARLEVINFQYSKAPEYSDYSFQSLRMDKIALNNYYKNYNLATGANDGIVTKCTNLTTGIWDWIQAQAAPWANEFSDFNVGQGETAQVAAGSEATAGKVVKYSAGGEPTSTQAISFGITKVDEKTNNPELMLSFYGVDAAGQETPHYLIAKFAQNAEPFAPGKIYQVAFNIQEGKDGTVSPPWDDPQRCIELTVTVKSWEVVSVTPEF